MTLAALQAILQVKTGTHIGEIILDSELYFSLQRPKTYPIVLWSLDGATFKKDSRSTVIQKNKELSFTAFIVSSYDPNTQTRIAVYDTLESYFDEYINKMNTSTSVQIVGIESIKGKLLNEGGSPDKELGIMYEGIIIKSFC